MEFTLDKLDNQQDEYPVCIGRFYRVRKSAYSGKKIVFSTTLSLLKRKSCPGCKTCDWVEDDINEGLSHNVCTYIEGLDDCKDGDIVRFIVAIDGTDWESGLVDSWHLRAMRMTKMI